MLFLLRSSSSDHTFHGVFSLAQSSFRYWYSRYLSRMNSFRPRFLRYGHAFLVAILFIRPYFPRGLLTCPEFVQVLVFAICVHGEEEAIMAIGHKLSQIGRAHV